jgi:hypothetical protein
MRPTLYPTDLPAFRLLRQIIEKRARKHALDPHVHLPDIAIRERHNFYFGKLKPLINVDEVLLIARKPIESFLRYCIKFPYLVARRINSANPG